MAYTVVPTPTGSGTPQSVTRDGTLLTATVVPNASVGKGSAVVTPEGGIPGFTVGGPVAGSGIQVLSVSSRTTLLVLNQTNQDVWAVLLTPITIDGLPVGDRVVECAPGATAIGPFTTTYTSEQADGQTPPVNHSNTVRIEFASSLPGAAIPLASATTADPIEITSDAPHGLLNGDSVTLSGITGDDAAELEGNTYVITKTAATKFTIDYDSSAKTLVFTNAVATPVIVSGNITVFALTTPSS